MIITTIFKIECVSNVWPLVYIKIIYSKTWLYQGRLCILRFVFLLMKIIDYNTNTVDFHFVVKFYSSILDIFHNLLSVIKVFIKKFFSLSKIIYFCYLGSCSGIASYYNMLIIFYLIVNILFTGMKPRNSTSPSSIKLSNKLKPMPCQKIYHPTRTQLRQPIEEEDEKENNKKTTDVGIRMKTMAVTRGQSVSWRKVC